MGAISENEESRTGGNDSSGKTNAESQYSATELDQMFHILRNRRRRDILWYLLGASKQVTLSDLAEHIAARECEKPVGELKSHERKRVYVGLYQGHLPKMDSFDVVNFDQNRGTVEPGPDFTRFVAYLPDEEAPSGESDLSGAIKRQGTD